MAETTTAAANEPVAATSGGEARTAPQGGMGIPFGAIPPEPTQEAIDGIRFDFNDGLRVKLPEGAKPYLIRFFDLENQFTAFESVTPAGGGGTILSTKKYFVRYRLTVADPATGKGRLVGDVCFAEAEPVASAITPVPGGVGPMTIAGLMRNAVRAARWHLEK